MHFSFCVTCRSRLADLQATLPANLEMLLPDEEIVVLDYNSPDGLWAWLLEIGQAALAAGRLRVYAERTALRFWMAHAKNVSHLLGRGEILINLDADNLLRPAYLAELRDYNWGGKAAVYPRCGGGGWSGRTAIRATVFQQVGGYDERMTGYGYEEVDLRRRLGVLHQRVGSLRHVGRADQRDTPLAVKTESNDGVLPAVTNTANMQLCVASVRAGRWWANAARIWGKARLVDHDGHVLHVGHEGCHLEEAHLESQLTRAPCG